MSGDDLTFEIPSITEIYDYLAEIAGEIKKAGIKIDTIIGISRGGLVPARFLSDFLLIPDIKIISAGFYLGPKKRMDKPIIYTPLGKEVENKTILLVDDVADTGETLIAVEKHILERGAKKVYIAVIYKKPWNKARVDFYSRETDAWIVFPWEFTETAYQLSKMDTWKKFESIIIRDERLKKIVERFLEKRV